MKKALGKTAIVFTILFAIIQIGLLIYFFQSPQHSDQVLHVRLANLAYNAEVWYPSVMNLYDSFIVAPGLINFLTIQLHLFGTVDYNGFFQFIMNMIMLYEVFFIGKKLFSLTTGYISAILYCLLYSNYMGILVWGTEIPFLFFALSGVCLCLTGKWYNILLGGLLFSVSNTIRPLVLLFVILVVVYFFIKKVKWSNYILLLVPFFILNFGYGKMNEHRIGYFVNQSTTGGTNLIQTAHDRADGTTSKGYCIVGDKDSPYAYENNKDKTVFEKDEMWKNAGIEWIKHNPGKYFMMFFKKIPYMYADDAWPERLVFDTGFQKSMGKDISTSEKIKIMIGIVLKNIIYYAILCLFAYSLYLNRKSILSIKGVLLLFLLIGTGATVLFPVMPRYHYPFLFVIIIWAAYGIESIINKKLNNQRNHELA